MFYLKLLLTYFIIKEEFSRKIPIFKHISRVPQKNVTFCYFMENYTYQKSIPSVLEYQVLTHFLWQTLSDTNLQC